MAHIYKTKDGTRVPSVTGISGLYGDKGGLIYWANDMGLQGKTLQDAREETASPGSMMHERADYYIRGKDWHAGPWEEKFSSPEAFESALKKCAQAFDNFKRWHAQSQIKLIAGEVALVSEQHKFGGRLDAIATSGGVALADWKSGGGGKLYADFLYQVGGGYAILWEENFPDMPLTGGTHIVRFNRDEADFAHWSFADLSEAKRGFLLLREMYEINKGLKKRL